MQGMIEDDDGLFIEDPGEWNLTVTDVEDTEGDYGPQVLVAWRRADGATWRQYVSTDGDFKWQVKQVLRGLGLPCGKGAPWDSAEWIGRTARVKLVYSKSKRKDGTPWLQAKRMAPVAKPDVPGPDPAPELDAKEEDSDIPF